MNRFSKLLLIPAAVIAIAGGVGIAAATNGSGGDDLGTSTTVDVKGPCDELEHATDPRCDGVLVPEDNEADDPAGDNDDGQADDQNDGNGQRRPGRGTIRHVEDQDDDQGEDVDDQGENEDDNSGPSANSGPGSSHDDGDDNSGHGDDDSGSDDGGHSGPGGGEAEDD